LGSNASVPGRIITMTPRNPTKVAAQRRQRTVSCRMKTASTIANSGLEKLSAL
jgi:hypothetical protein